MAFYDLEPLIVGRLREILGATVKDVLTTEDLAGVLEQRQIIPAVHVIYATYSVKSQTRATIDARQHWNVVAAANNVRGIGSGEAARKDVAPIVDGIFAALKGWSPPGCNGRWCELESPPAKAVITDGFIYVPMQWSFPLAL